MDVYRFVENDAYSSPSDDRYKCWTSRLFGTTVPFYFKTLKVVLKYRSVALKGELDHPRWVESSLVWTEIIEQCGGRIEISGREHVRGLDGPAVFVGNHMSTAEAFFLPGAIVSILPLTFVVKDALVNQPLFGHVMRASNPITVSRDNSRADLKKVMEQGKEHLSKGTSVLIFPQSTRSPEFDSSKFNSLGAKLASRANVPVIPFAVKTDMWSTGKFIKDLGEIRADRTVHLKFGPPIPADVPAKAVQKQIVEHVRSNLTAWGATCV